MSLAGCHFRIPKQKQAHQEVSNRRLHLGQPRSCSPMRSSPGRRSSSTLQLNIVRRHRCLLRRDQLRRQQHAARGRRGRRPYMGDRSQPRRPCCHCRGERCHRRGPRWRARRRGGRHSSGRGGCSGLDARLLPAAQQAVQQAAQLALQGGLWLACSAETCCQQRRSEYACCASPPALTSCIW